MGKVLALPERQGTDGAWHQVLHDVCYGCGCRYLLAEDDRDLVWELASSAFTAMWRPVM
jgi:hypothetical protein